MKEFPEYYKILQINTSATMADVKTAYHKLAKKYHPDLNKGDKKSENKLKEINEAYGVLGDLAKRAEYDYLGKQNNAVNKTTNYNPQAAKKDKPNLIGSLAKLVLHYVTALLLLFALVGFVYSNRGNNDERFLLNGLINSGNKIGDAVSLMQKNAQQYYTEDKLQKKLWAYVLRHNNLFLAKSLLKIWPQCYLLDKGNSLLMKAKTPNMAQLLIDAGCDINSENEKGETAYLQAIKDNNVQLASMLRKNGAIIKIRWRKNTAE